MRQLVYEPASDSDDDPEEVAKGPAWADGEEDEDEEDEDEEEEDELGTHLGVDSNAVQQAHEFEKEKMIGEEGDEMPIEERLKQVASSYNPQTGKTASRKARANKNRPTEVSSKRQITRYREIVENTKTKSRDPRFETLCGNFNQESFRKTHAFIFEEKLPQEKQQIAMQLKKQKGEAKKGELKRKLSIIAQQIKQDVQTQKMAKTEAERKRSEREAVKQGKKPFHLKKGDRKKEELIQKYKELKKAGKLESFLEKRRKKNSQKDTKSMPFAR
ncbi:hypothetical protein CYMTET_5140 [Cymbomonas tetramitiformis]|uniref:rRNA biogenesis protein RRP36 n=1 Tax=Cymbomonas tetramitiformis TaxID=36881 RepID=A0AAE0GZX4_9CHLO|nr:hypothetical protein CYMTET_5140 [Cymbomonas tetramitiformis]